MEAKNREEWLAARKKGIGGSDAAAVLGLSPWQTPLDLFQEKMGLVPEKPQSEAMLWGLILEEKIRQTYCDQTLRRVTTPNRIISHPEHPWMLCNLDGITDDDRLVEIKNSSSSEWGEPGTDAIPIHYLCQVQHNLMVTRKRFCDVPVLLRGNDFRIYTVESEPGIQALILDKEQAFMRRIEKNEPPPPQDSADARRWFRTAIPSTVVADDASANAVSMLKSLRNQISILEANAESIKAGIMGYMAEHDTLVGPEGEVLVTWKKSKDGTRLDVDNLKKSLPQVWAEYQKPAEGSRRFLVK
jgi:putative phage-type endonuclease